jgi:hypothetical protein
MTASPASHLGVLTYASPEVRTSPPRTIVRMIFAALVKALGLLLGGLRLCVVGLGYAVLGAGIAVRFAFAFVAMLLLFVGGLRWDVVKRRTLGGANWVDAKVLNTMGFLRRHLLPRGWSGAAR